MERRNFLKVGVFSAFAPFALKATNIVSPVPVEATPTAPTMGSALPEADYVTGLTDRFMQYLDTHNTKIPYIRVYAPVFAFHFIKETGVLSSELRQNAYTVKSKKMKVAWRTTSEPDRTSAFLKADIEDMIFYEVQKQLEDEDTGVAIYSLSPTPSIFSLEDYSERKGTILRYAIIPKEDLISHLRIKNSGK